MFLWWSWFSIILFTSCQAFCRRDSSKEAWASEVRFYWQISDDSISIEGAYSEPSSQNPRSAQAGSGIDSSKRFFDDGKDGDWAIWKLVWITSPK